MILDAYDWKILNPESRSILTTAHAHLIQSFGSQVSPWCLINRYTKGEEFFTTEWQFAKEASSRYYI